jgi:hypothetical protein
MIPSPIDRRILFALGLLAGVIALATLAPDAFVPAIAATLIAAPVVNWRAWWRLRTKRGDRRLRGLDPIVSLRSAESAALYLAIGSTVTASLGLFVAARALGLVEAVDRQVFLVVLSYPPLLATLPAFDWLLTVGRLEREERAKKEANP